MPDTLTIAIDDMPIHLRLGVPEAERARAQVVLVTVRLTRAAPVPFAPGARIGATVNYDDLIHFIRETLPARGPYVLIESVADAVAAHALAVAGGAAQVSVTVKKPSVLTAPGMASVTLHRSAS